MLFFSLCALFFSFFSFFFFNDTATTEIYTLSLHDALPIFLFGTPQVGLQHHAYRVPEFRIERPLEELQGALDVIGLLHVDPHEGAERLGLGDDGAQVFDAQLLGDVEPHLRELDRDVGVGAGRRDAIEGLEIGVPSRMRLGGVVDRFAQHVEAGADPRRVQVFQGGDPGRHGLPRDEARREAAGETVAPDEAEDARLLAEPEEAGAEHRSGARATGVRRRGPGAYG